jgi:hypothetical protein
MAGREAHMRDKRYVFLQVARRSSGQCPMIGSGFSVRNVPSPKILDDFDSISYWRSMLKIVAKI